MKGEYNQECNITSCQRPNSAVWFNHSTRKYYCESCAKRLNEDVFNARDAQEMFGHSLCTLEEKEHGITITKSAPKTGKSDILSNVYLNTLRESEEMQFYMREFGGLRKNPTQEKYRTMPKSKLLELYEEVMNKTSKLSRRERDLVTYYATK